MRPSSFKYLVKQGLASVWHNRVNTFASLCIVIISLMMVGFAVLASLNISRLIGSIEQRNEVVVVILDGTPDNNISLLGSRLAENPNIFEVNFYSKEEAWIDMQSEMTADEQALFDYITENPLPDCYRVRVSDISLLSQTVSEIQAMDSVELVKAPNDFASILTSVRNVGAVVFIVIIVALAVACLVIISNSTRTSVYARRREINIMRYVGASKSFIRIPFFVEGLTIGLLASVVAFGLTWFAYVEIYNIATDYLKAWSFFTSSVLIPFKDLALATGVCYLACGALISSLGTVMATRKHLNV